MAAKKRTAKAKGRAVRPSHTTVRVDADTHGRLMKMSDETGKSLGHVISDAVRALEHHRFHEQLNEDYRAMREDPEAWAAFVKDQDEWLLGVPVSRDNT
ncbi:MAG: hypothetical protein EBT79_06570 [Actinobacteria bacterium]|nr:hypothetical protein [Actinomycetota bacterium]NDE03003.1 hypothetical protein [Gammaproteobacteria bacterium]